MAVRVDEDQADKARMSEEDWVPVAAVSKMIGVLIAGVECSVTNIHLPIVADCRMSRDVARRMFLHPFISEAWTWLHIKLSHGKEKS